MSAQSSAGPPLLLVIDPVARTIDGESVRIAKDVLCAGAPSLKICLPETGEELERALAHRGRRRPVVVGDDAALLRTVRFLHRERTLGEAAVSLVPVGHQPSLTLARALGLPRSAVAAARAVLGGAERSLDLLVDDGGGIVVGALRIPGECGGCLAHAPHPRDAAHPAPWATEGPEDGGCGRLGGGGWLGRGARTLVRTLTAPLEALPISLPLPRPDEEPGAAGPDGGHRLRVEADGVLLADLDRPVHEVSVLAPADDGLAEIFVRHPEGNRPVRARARAVTVSGRDFHYRADERDGGPVRHRTWTVQRRAWRLTVPAQRARQ